jgi:hypothetical protein
MALHNQHKAIGHLGNGADGVRASMAVGSANGSGRGMTLTPVTGLGRVMIEDLEGAIARAKAQHRADRIAAARDRRMQQVGHSDLAVRF